MRALIIDDDPDWAATFKDFVTSEGMEAKTLGSWSEALVKLKDLQEPYDLIVLDLFQGREPFPRGLFFLDELQKHAIGIPVTVVTLGDEISKKTLRDLFHNRSIFDYFEKRTFSSDEFRKSIRKVREIGGGSAVEQVKRICERVHLVVRELARRHDGRATLTIKDEYDVQDLLRCLLRGHFGDVRMEEWAPSFANASARMDILLKDEKIVVEAKMTRPSLKQKEVLEQLTLDAAKYKGHPDCKTLICMIYDPEHRIENVPGAEADLAGLSTNSLKVVPIIVPHPL